MLLRPPQPRTPLIAVLTVATHGIAVHLPQRDEVFRVAVRDLGYRWTGTRWERRIDERFHGSIRDRAIELGHALLLAGFVIEVPDDLHEAIGAGDYVPECRHWITVLQDGSAYHGWFIITWPRSDDHYAAARRVRGSRYVDGRVIVPPESYLDIQDFADLRAFHLSDGARRVVAEQEARHAAALVVVPTRRTPSPRRVVSTQPAGSFVPTGTIDPELQDVDTDD